MNDISLVECATGPLSTSTLATSTNRILIVDDNPSIHKDFEKILGKRDTESELMDSELQLFGTTETAAVVGSYEIDHAYQGIEGLEMVKRSSQENRPYDLAIVDMRMPPGWDGLETIENLWQVDPGLQVVICTAFSDYSWRQIAERLHNSDNLLILKKPFDNIEVSQLAAALTKKRGLMRERDQYTRLLETRVREQTLTTRRAHEETIFRLVNVSRFRDTETGEHVQRVGKYSAVLAKLAGWSPEEVEQIRMAAPMHDVGKIGIPDSVLLKTGPFTAEDRRIMQQHTLIGFKMLAGSESEMLQTASEIALSHHENWDGSGYPYKKMGDAIPSCARIVSIVDVYDALSQDRIYRNALPHDEIIALMRKEIGIKFDPELAELFFKYFDEFETIAISLREGN